jgi:hypothetical protein
MYRGLCCYYNRPNDHSEWGRRTSTMGYMFIVRCCECQARACSTDNMGRCTICSLGSPPVVHLGLAPVGVELSHIFFGDGVVVLLGDVAALLVVVHPLLPVAGDDLLAQDLDRLVRHLPLPAPLLDGPQVRDGILGPASLCYCTGIMEVIASRDDRVPDDEGSMENVNIRRGRNGGVGHTSRTKEKKQDKSIFASIVERSYDGQASWIQYQIIH